MKYHRDEGVAGLTDEQLRAITDAPDLPDDPEHASLVVAAYEELSWRAAWRREWHWLTAAT